MHTDFSHQVGLPPPEQSGFISLIFNSRSSSIPLMLCLSQCKVLPRQKDDRSRNKFCRQKITCRIGKALPLQPFPPGRKSRSEIKHLQHKTLPFGTPLAGHTQLLSKDHLRSDL